MYMIIHIHTIYIYIYIYICINFYMHRYMEDFPLPCLIAGQCKILENNWYMFISMNYAS